ncbi:MAG: hypothetical protein D6702_13155 [Planctomycetota bacterium]|nr:MAG: hypothetical protein D6702_13155 [Planctomycetota bacterium]
MAPGGRDDRRHARRRRAGAGLRGHCRQRPERLRAPLQRQPPRPRRRRSGADRLRSRVQPLLRRRLPDLAGGWSVRPAPARGVRGGPGGSGGRLRRVQAGRQPAAGAAGRGPGPARARLPRPAAPRHRSLAGDGHPRRRRLGGRVPARDGVHGRTRRLPAGGGDRRADRRRRTDHRGRLRDPHRRHPAANRGPRAAAAVKRAARRSWPAAFAGLLAGAAGPTLLQGALRLPLAAPAFAAEVLALCAAGGLVLGLLAWPPVWLLARVRVPAQPPRAATAFWIGWAFGLAPLTHNLLFLDGGGPVLRLAAVLLPVLVVGAAAPRLGELLPPPPAGVWAVLGLAVLAWPAGRLLLPGRDAGPGPELPPPPAAAAPTVDPDHPDVILISIDTLRADALFDPEADLPNFDRLRTEGAWAPFALSSSNQTLPAHVGLLTGTTAEEHGVRDNRGALPAGLPLLAERFRERGWRTAGVVSNGLLRGAAGFARGFEAYDDQAVAHAGAARLLVRRTRLHTPLGWLLPERLLRSLLGATLLRDLAEQERAAVERGPGERVTERGLAFLRRARADRRPLFLFLHYMDPHTPYGAPPPFGGRHTAALALPGRYRLDRFGRAPLELTTAVERDLQSGDPAVVRDALAALDFLRAMYREEVEFVDHCLGRILAEVETGGRPTLLAVTGDHGEQFGEHGLTEHADSLYEPLLRVPCLLWGSGVIRGELPPPRLADLAAVLLAPGRLPPAADFHFARDDRRLAVRVGARKWIVELRPGSPPRHLGLYDLAADPDEEHDLGRSAVPAELEQAVLDFAAAEAARVSMGASSPDPEQSALLHEMGYAGGTENGDG